MLEALALLVLHPHPVEAAPFSQVQTECDRLAANPDDPDKVAPGVSRAQMDKPAAIAACQAAVAADPENPRLLYQLARALGYAGRGAEAIALRQKAVDLNYPQSLFVIGYITLFGMNEQPQDTCVGGELIRRSAGVDRIAGQVGFVTYLLEGMFDDCNFEITAEELHGYIDGAEAQIGGDYYKEMLVKNLRRDVTARYGPA